MNKKKTFVAYSDWIDYTDEMDDAAVADLFRAILAKANGVGYEISSPVARAVFKRVGRLMDDDLARYEEVCRKRKESGAKGGKTKQMLANAIKCKQTLANASKAKQNLHDNENDNDTDNDTDSHVYERESNNNPPALTDVCRYFSEANLKGKASEFFSYYEARGWKDITDWQAAAWVWSSRESKFSGG